MTTITKIPYVVAEEQLHDPCSFSKSPLKPGLLNRKIMQDQSFMRIGNINPLTAEQMEMVHDAGYIRDLMNGDAPDGFGNYSTKDFRAIRTAAANFVFSAKLAVATSGPVWSLTSGFHHACHDHAEGFCTIDALSLAAKMVWVDDGVRSLIIDGDAHFGNGTVENIEMNDMDYCRYLQSVHDHVYTGQPFDNSAYRRELEAVLAQHNPGLIMYQAGADAWVGDPLGGCLTMSELYQRDITVLSVAKQAGIPVVVNLAGGYAGTYEHSLQIHMNTGEAMKEVYLGYGCATIPVDVVQQEEA
jgi:acetoin utilization deacetylase AcuC-like enzyme